MSRKLLLSLFLLTTVVTATANDIFWYDGIQPVTYRVEGEKAPVVDIALSMFADDMALVTGKKAVPSKEGVIRIYQLDKCQQAVSQLKKMGVPVDELMQKQDAFYIGTSMGNIIVVGNNGRGCAYGLLELSRMAGVSPWVWWGDVVPEKKSRLTLDETFTTLQSPSVEYRGIFINDEDWSLRNWSSKTFEPTGRTGIGPKTYKEIFKLLLRLRANAIWPAMHEGGTGFFTVAGNKEMADSCGIIVGTSHCEPLLRNNVAEWDKKKRGPYNYITNRKQVQQYWTERLEQVKGSEELFTIGMRGIHDGSMEGVKTPEEKLNGLQQVINDQRELIRQYYNKNVEQVPQVFIPYKEVLEIMESGLKVPDDVTLMWCDDNYGYMTRLSDEEQQRRSGGGGVYYHLSYWGRPHDYLWLTTTQPGLIYSEMKAAYDHQCRRLWIVNVHDPKVAAYDLELFLDMAWNIDGVTPSTLYAHLERWLCTQFGEEAGRQLTPVMKEFYRLCGIRKPEFMGWTQSELDKRKFPRGMSEVGSIELTPQEAADRMQMFDRLKAEIEKCRLLIRPELADAFFAHVVYPVYAAAAMTSKMVNDKAESHQAYEEIQQLTAQYNQLAGGKWHGLMDASPRRLPVFGDTNARLQEESEPFMGVARNACDYQSSSTLNPSPSTIQMLGHSMNAVAIPKGCELTYEFETCQEGNATLYTAMIPTQPHDKGNLRYSVQIDDQKPVVISLKESYRSETWKKNVLRGQALKQTPVCLTPTPSLKGEGNSKGRHTLKVKALDNHIIFDQWMLDFKAHRKFYVIPVGNCDPLRGKKIGFLGDSYVRNHREPVENTWHYKFAQKHQMEYYNYGRNGNCIALDLKQWGTGMYQRYKDMRDDLDYVVVIAGHNDASQGRIDSIGIDTFKERLGMLCQGLKERYPHAQIFFYTPWNCENFEGSVRQLVVDTMIEVCGSYGIPIFDAARHSGIDAASDQFRSIYFQGGGKNDHAHLNAKGHDRFLPIAEHFLLQYMNKP